LADFADPHGLWMLIPSLVVFVVALSGRHFLAALTAGALSAVVVGPVTGLFTLGDVFHVTSDGKVAGSAVRGALGLMPTAILTLLLVTTIGIMQAGGFLNLLLARLRAIIGDSVSKAEMAIIGLISFTNICVSVNTVAMITAGPLANILRKEVKLHPYRVANLLDTVSCSFPYVLPYATSVVAAVATQQQVALKYPTVPVVHWGDFAGYFFYGHVLLPLMILSALTGFGRRRG
jgi:Na+/H+ antiporter NhaC